MTLQPLNQDFVARFFCDLLARGLFVPAPQLLSGGRSNHVWKAGTLVIKLFEQRQNNPLFDNDPLREAQALESLAGTGMVPPLAAAGQFEGHHWLAYSHIKGTLWNQDTGHVAQLLGRLHDQSPFSGLPQGANGSAQLEQQTTHILNAYSGAAAPREAVACLRPLGRVPPLSTVGLIHGDPVPGNLVAHDGTLTLIDWQCPQLGDPAEDLAVFLSPAMQFLYRGRILGLSEEEEFLRAYPDVRTVGRYLALKPWFHWRMAAYCLWRSEGMETGNDFKALQLELEALRQSINPRRA